LLKTLQERAINCESDLKVQQFTQNKYDQIIPFNLDYLSCVKEIV